MKRSRLEIEDRVTQAQCMRIFDGFSALNIVSIAKTHSTRQKLASMLSMSWRTFELK
jgi:hypothetical protein